MPQLRSGRHFGLHSPWAEWLTAGSDEQKYYCISWFRLKVPDARRLRDHLQVIYFRTDEGVPPDAPRYPSGFFVDDVLAGKAGWTEDEVAELRDWLETDPRVGPWVESEFEAINRAIRDDPLWESELVRGD